MYCPKCATQNLDGASYCRACGANVSLVPQALTGQLPQASDDDDTEGRGRRRRRHNRQASIEHAFKNVFMGIAFLLVSVALSFSIGAGWWFWMLIPAFSLMGTGVAEYIRFRENQKATQLAAGAARPSIDAPPFVGSLPPRNTGEMVPPPPSVTEGTTRHLGAEARTRHLDGSTEIPK